MKVFAIIPAAGLGTRMSAGRPAARSKQFTELGGQPILLHTLRRFAESPQIERTFVALRKNEIQDFQKRLNKEPFADKVELVEGGDNRQQSVANALDRLKAGKDDIVLVHDAVRPFVTRSVIEDVIKGAQKHDAVIAGVPAVDTIKQVDRTADGAIITSTIPRERIVMAQTPQGFRYLLLKKAFDEAQADNFTGTDEASLVERSGHTVAVVMGSPRNIKITTPADMELAEFYLSAATEKKK
ncbi:MAG TPA: 2-C-methyl-D-erythritol 4-phosphate cytidylyltransferase [Terriglobales bacterium]|nr:2-C-methyl-D-erythritol 4-phosphate cytidylyltransferase [Terriglobales bacterium]